MNMRILHGLSLPLLLLLLLHTQFLASVRANTEKTIFVAPPSITIPNVHPGLDDLCIASLTPDKPIVQTQLPLSFPNKTAPKGRESWYLLDRLRAGQRYEVRVCWVATVSPASCLLRLVLPVHGRPSLPTLGLSSIWAYTTQQPTEFWLDTFPISEVFETPSLISGLAEYSGNQPQGACPEEASIDSSISGSQTSVLFLRLYAAADYFSTNKTLMREPPLVGVDISGYRPLYERCNI
jgi:hypothetical protein